MLLLMVLVEDVVSVRGVTSVRKLLMIRVLLLLATIMSRIRSFIVALVRSL